MLPDPFMSGMCLEIMGTPDCLEFSIKDEREGLWWSGAEQIGGWPSKKTLATVFDETPQQSFHPFLVFENAGG